MAIKLSINSKSCTTLTTDVQNVCRLKRHKLQERVYREKIRTVEELQQRVKRCLHYRASTSCLHDVLAR